jgi:nucleolar complex protein 2
VISFFSFNDDIIEDCLKQIYLAYARTSKSILEATLPTLTFLGNSVMELYSLDMDSSYQHAFVYIRQLALHLRLELQKKTKEPFQVVYCWQYLNSCKAWFAILSANPGKDELYSLVYPLTEIIWGVAKLLSLEQPKERSIHEFLYVKNRWS